MPLDYRDSLYLCIMGFIFLQYNIKYESFARCVSVYIRVLQLIAKYEPGRNNDKSGKKVYRGNAEHSGVTALLQFYTN